jgi:hypothetical protein
MSSHTTAATCPKCGARLRIPGVRAAVSVRCAACGTALRFRPKTAVPGRLPEPVIPSPAASVPAPSSFEDLTANSDGARVSAGAPRVVLAVAPTRAKSRSTLYATLASAAMLVLATALVWPYRHQLFTRDRVLAVDKPSENPARDAPSPDSPKQSPPSVARFDRRILTVAIHNYLYANPTLAGPPSRGPAAVTERLAQRWRIPEDQVFVVTDGPGETGPAAATKAVVETTIAEFLRTSRPQDHVVILYVGHATVVDTTPYLVPLDGELGVKGSLIPLSWLYDQLRRCRASQKVLIFDACREEPGAGSERPNPGPMAAELHAALGNPPEGVQVWTACSATQPSLEFKYQQSGGVDVEGGVFLNQILQASLEGEMPAGDPGKPIPLGPVAERVGRLTRQFAQAVQRRPQVPSLAGDVPGEPVSAVDAKPPPRIAIPRAADLIPGGAADPAVVNSIFAEIRTPPIRAVSEDTAGDRIGELLPFSAEVLRAYSTDATDTGSAETAPDGLRKTVRNGIDVLRRHGRGEVVFGATQKTVGALRQTLPAPVNDRLKQRIATEQKEGPGAMYVELDQLIQDLEKLAKQREGEPSKRWQANYDYVLAVAKARFAYINEYNFALGKVRKDELPALDAKLHNGWRLASADKVSAPREVRDHADEARTLFDRVIREHAGTPWEVLAKRERLTALGLAWQPASLRATRR